MSTHPDRHLLEQAGELDGPERLALLEHVHGCAACRTAMVEADPTAVFRLLAVEPIPERVLEQVSAGVAAELDRTRSSRRPVWGWVAAAAIAAAVLSWPLWRSAPTGLPTPTDAAGSAAGALPAAAGERAIVELLEAPETAQLIDLDVDGVQLVMIFDEEIDL